MTYSDVGGCKEQIEKLREVVETPLLNVRPPFSPLCFKSDEETAGAVRRARYRPSQGCTAFRSPRNRQDALRPRRRQPHRRDLYPCHRLRARAEVRRRRSTNGSRAIRNGEIEEGVYHLL